MASFGCNRFVLSNFTSVPFCKLSNALKLKNSENLFSEFCAVHAILINSECLLTIPCGSCSCIHF